MKEGNTTRGWAIVGLGKHADAYLAPAIQKAPSARLAAVCSRDRAKAEAFAAKHGADRAYGSFDELLSDPAVEVVHIASPNSLHADQTVQAARAGKHIMCEKPMSLTVADGERMVEICRSHRVKLGVGFQNRHHPAHQEARRLIVEGAVGEITHAVAQYGHGFISRSLSGWRADPAMAGGGSLMGSGLHCLDLLRFLLGKEVEEVVAATDMGQPDRPVDEVVLAILKFRDGPYCFAVSGLHIPRIRNDVVVYGTKARITGSGTVGTKLQGELCIDADELATRMQFPVAEPIIGSYIRQVEDFNQSIDQDTEPKASGVDGIEMIRVAEAILESSRTGRTVRVSR